MKTAKDVLIETLKGLVMQWERILEVGTDNEETVKNSIEKVKRKIEVLERWGI